MKMIKNLDRKVIFLFLACLAVCTAIYVYFASEKTVWFCDEMYTYTIATNGTFGISFAEQSWCSGQDIANAFLIADGPIDFGKVIAGTAGDNHPPAYYVIFHVIATVLGKYSEWIGYLTNYIFFIGCIAMIYGVIYHFCKKAELACLAGIVFSSNGGILSNALLIRMYLMMMFLLFLYLVLMYRLYQGKDKAILYVLLTIVTAIGFLTNYVFVIYLFYFSIVYVVYSILKKRFLLIVKYAAAEIAAAVVGIGLFPASLQHIFVGNKGASAFQKATDIQMLLTNIMDAVKIQNQLLFSKLYLIGIIGFIVVSILFFYRQRKAENGTIVQWFVGTNIFAMITYMITVRQVFLAENRYLYLSMYMEYVLLIFMLLMLCREIKTERKWLVLVKSGMPALIVLLFMNLYQNIPNPQIEYFGTDEMKAQWEIMEAERQTPWIYYGDFDWVSMNCALDFTIPEHIYCVKSDSTPQHDERLEENDRFIVYMNENNVSIDNLITYLQESVGGTYQYKCMMDNRLNLKVYEVWKSEKM